MNHAGRGITLGLGWLGTYYLLVQYGAFALPSSIASNTTLPQYLAGVQLLSLALGVFFVLRFTRSAPDLRRTILPETAGLLERDVPLWVLALWAALIGPLVYYIASKLAIHLALDALLAEIASRGTQAVQQQTGELGRRAQADTLATILPFTVLIAPLGEELLFRGGIYGAVQSLFRSEQTNSVEEEESPPSSLHVAGLPQKKGPSFASRILVWATSGGVAMVISSFIFGGMHADVDGAMGIVRLVSASVLGVACGVARHWSSSLAAPIALHVVFNFLALATMRRWLIFEGWPTEQTVPTILLPVSLICLCLVLAHGVWWKFIRRATR